MTGYILSILGIVIAGLFIDIIIPSGNINKYIKSVYSIFVVTVIISPVVKFLHKTQNMKIEYENYSVNIELLDYIYSMRVASLEKNLEKALETEGFDKVDIILNFSIENDDLTYLNCQVNLKNMVISADKQHINKYEFIKEVIASYTNLKSQEIQFNE